MDVLRGPVLGCQCSYGFPLVLKNKNGGRRVARSTKWRCPDFEIVSSTSPARTGTFFQGGTPMDAVTDVPRPVNEPVLSYAPGSPERAELLAVLEELGREPVELPMRINGRSPMGRGEPIDAVRPHDHASVLGTMRNATHDDAREAVAAAKAAAPAWRAMSFDDRAAIILRAAELLSGPWRATINAATMLGQSKTIQQAEIDSAC